MFTISHKNIHVHCDREIDSNCFPIIDDFYKKILKIPLFFIKRIDFYVNFGDKPIVRSYKISFYDTNYETTVFKDGEFIIESHTLNSSDSNKNIEATYFRYEFLDIIKEMK